MTSIMMFYHTVPPLTSPENIIYHLSIVPNVIAINIVKNILLIKNSNYILTQHTKCCYILANILFCTFFPYPPSLCHYPRTFVSDLLIT